MALNISVIDIEPCMIDTCAMVIKEVQDVAPTIGRIWIETSIEG
jgi:hypothetical protein